MEEFGIDKQKLYISYLLRDTETFVRCMNILKPEYFNQELRNAVKFIVEYTEKYKNMPNKALIDAETKQNYSSDVIDNATEKEIIDLKEWFLDDFERFCKKQALTKEILNAASAIENGEYEGIDTRIKEALLISLNKELGTDYFDDPKARLSSLLNNNNMTSTGWKTIDDKLYGGMNRGEITIFAGNSGMGKSLFLQNITINWALQKKNVVYFTFELSEVLTSMRLDAMMAGMGTRDVVKNMDTVHHIIKRRQESCGHIQLKYMSPGANANDLRAYLKEYQIQTGKIPDAVAIDYLDLMHPCNKKINPSDMFIKDKYVTEELRGMAAELGILCATASQLNRGAVDEQVHQINDIAGGLSKVNTADNVMTIYTSPPMRERGEYRVQFIKTRSSSGVGSSVTLKFDQLSLRIMDDPEADGGPAVKPSTTIQEQLQNKLKNRAATQKTSDKDEEHTTSAKSIQPDQSSTKINSLAILNKIKKL